MSDEASSQRMRQNSEMMKNCLALALLACFLSACSDDYSEARSSQANAGRTMPDIFQPVTPSQQRAIMSGEPPDWTEVSPAKISRR